LATYDILARSSGAGGPKWITDSQGVLAGCTGALTLSNIVLRTLFTTKGTVATSRSEGTYLPNLVGVVADIDQAKASAVASISDAESYIKKMQSRSPVSKKETLSRLVLNNILVGDGPSLLLRVLIYNADDDVIPLEVIV
jgi:hypothetical protein